MAYPVHGVTVTWGGTTLREVTSSQVNLQPGPPKGRTVLWTHSYGTVDLTANDNNALPSSEWGKRKRLIIKQLNTANAEVTLLDADCIFNGPKFEQKLQDIVRFGLSFQIMDTVDAESHP